MAHDRPVLMIPGPIEYSQRVLDAGSRFGTSHVDPHFIAAFSDVLKSLRVVFQSSSESQPFVMAGSGSLGWDMITCNVARPGDKAVVVSQGYFGHRWEEVCRMYGVEAEIVSSPSPSEAPRVSDVEAAVRRAGSSLRLVTLTHVDTSTGVRADLKALAEAVHRIAPHVVVAVDGVCALGGEELRMEEWGIDAYLTGSQKALGVPPGLSVVMAGPRALEAHARVVKEGGERNYYAAWSRWTPIMQAYEAKRVAYFATPAVNLIYALQESVRELLADGGMDQRFLEHQTTAEMFRKALADEGFGFVANANVAAHTMSTVRYPKGVDGNAFRSAVKRHGAIVAGGLLSGIKHEYFRVGHMGYTSRQPHLVYVNRTLDAIRKALADVRGTAKL